MSGDHWIWSTLGIDPTDDVTAIRRGYARRLKQLDVDADPDAYAQLRHARDLAIEGASAAPISPDAPIPTSGVPAGESASSDPMVEAAPAGDAVADIDPMNEHHRLFVAILFPDGERSEAPLTSEEVEALEHHFSALIADPRLHDISWFAGASEWFAETLARAFPRSQSLLVPAARFFDWPAQDELRRSPAVHWVLSRIEGDMFAREVQSADHPLNDAWIELTTPADAKSKRGRVVKIEDVSHLLSIVRTRYPHLEDRFDWYRVQLWETPISTAWPVRAIVMIVVVVLFNLARCVDVSRPSLPPPRAETAVVDETPIDVIVNREKSQSGPALRDAPADIKWFFNAMFNGMANATDIQARDPKLYRQLVADWETVRNGEGDVPIFLDRAQTTVLTRAQQNLAKGSYALLVRHVRQLREEAQSIHDAHGEACAKFLEGGAPGITFAETIRNARLGVIAAALKEAGARDFPVAKPGPSRFNIPREVIDRVQNISGLTQQDLAQALQGKGPASARCNANLALLDALNSAPEAVALPMLQAMQGKVEQTPPMGPEAEAR